MPKTNPVPPVPQDLPVAYITPDQVKRSIFAMQLTPLSGKLTALARKLHIVIGRLSGRQYQLLSEDERARIEGGLRDYVTAFRAGKLPLKPTLLIQPRFSATLRELAEALEYEPSAARDLMPHLKLLEGCRVEFNSLGSGAALEDQARYPYELQVTGSLLSSVLRNGRGQVSWAFDPVILGIMVEPRTYAHLNLELVRNAQTYAAIALYENCRKFTRVKATGVYPMAKWRRLLSSTGQVPSWRDNDSELMRTVKQAIKELNACEGCDIDLEPVKAVMPDGSKGLQFRVLSRSQAKLPFGAPVPADRELKKKLREIGYSDIDATRRMEERDPDYLWGKIKLMEKTPNVRSKKAFLDSAIAKDYQDEAAMAEKAAKERATKELVYREAQQVQEAFGAWQSKRLRERFESLDEFERVTWETAYQAHAPATPVTGKAAKLGLFYAWLARQPHKLLDQPEDRDLLVFSALRPDKATAATA